VVILIRQARLPADAAAIGAIDTSFTSDVIYDVEAAGRAISLRAHRVQPPVSKRFALDDADDPGRRWSDAFIAEEEAICVGFAAVGFEDWNCRAILWHLYVQPRARRRGVARSLVDHAVGLARGLGARHLWLETSNLNAPGVAAYEALGFKLTGVDLTLYDGTPAEGEIALFFSRPIG
jgi:GNAT superfamily N-acetyltransferase